ncbi:MAG: hypothetical protein ACRDK7_08745 [Solirubrobacteraceae bacterium]
MTVATVGVYMAGGLSGTAALAQTPATDSVTVHVSQSNGTALEGVAIDYQCNDGYVISFGSTDVDGNVEGALSVDGESCAFSAHYRGTSATKTVTVANSTNVSFETSAVTVQLHNHAGEGLSGGQVAYRAGATVYWLNPEDGDATTTDPSGNVTGQMFAGTYGFRMQYNEGTEWQEGIEVEEGEAGTVTFQTGLLSLVYSGSISFGQGSSTAAWFTNAGTELLPGTYKFQPKGSGCVSLEIESPAAGASVTESIIAANLKDSSGAPLSGGQASYYAAGSWRSMGTTDAEGAVCAVFDGNLAKDALSVAMSYEGTRQQKDPQDEATESVFKFQTTDVSVTLKNADGNPLNGGSASYYAGGWHHSGETAGGKVEVQMLPGSYSFAMVYNNTREQRDAVPIGASSTEVAFQTGRLTVQFSQKFGWQNSEPYSFTPPTEEYLPGTISLSFEGCLVPVNIAAGDHLVGSGVLATLDDGAGHGVSGGSASVYHGGWQALGTTNARGQACGLVSGTLGNTSVAMVYNGTRQQITQDQATNSVYRFGESDVTVSLENSEGQPLDTGTASYYAGGWHDIGQTAGGKIHVEMLPGSYSFAMVYGGTREQLNGVAVSGSSSEVVFRTSDVAVSLESSSAEPLGGGGASYYAAGWHTVGTTSEEGGTTHVQMLPGSYSFAMVYQGTREQLNGVAVSGTTAKVVFRTSEVESSHATAYYAGGWHTFTSPMQLLPGTYPFRFDDGTPQTNETLGAGITSID